MFIATGAYSGYLPKAPGTWGSAVGVLLWVALARLPLAPYWASVGLLFILGVISAGAAEKIVDRGDPGLVVIDEIVGQLIALGFAPKIRLLPWSDLCFFACLIYSSHSLPVGWTTTSTEAWESCSMMWWPAAMPFWCCNLAFGR